MGTTSRGAVDWNTVIKPFLPYAAGALGKNEVVGLIKALMESEKEMRDGAGPFTTFYDVLTLLGVHVLTTAANNDLLPRANFPSVCVATRILCESLLLRLPLILKGTHPLISPKSFVNCIRELTTGEVILSPEEVTNMMTSLRSQDFPNMKDDQGKGGKDDQTKEDSQVKEIRRSRVDPASLILEQVCMPAMSFPSNKPMKVLLVQEVSRVLQSLRAGQKFVEICLSRPGLKPFLMEKFTLDHDKLKTNLNTVVKHKFSCTDWTQLVEDLTLIYQLMKVQVFGPLHPADAEALALLGMGMMGVAISVSTHFYCGSHSQDETEYKTGTIIIAQALWCQQAIIRILQDDIGLLQTTWLNCSCIFSKHAFLGINAYMQEVSRHSSEASTTSSKVNLVSVQNNWNSLITSVGIHAVELAHNFITLPESSSGSEKPLVEKPFQISGHHLPEERVAFFFDHSGILGTLIQLTTLSYKKAGKLKMVQAQKDEKEKGSMLGNKEEKKTLILIEDNEDVQNMRGDDENEVIDVEIEDENQSVSDLMTTEDEDDGDDDDDEDDEDERLEHRRRRKEEEAEVIGDDEPILGSWMESVLCPPEDPQTENGLSSGNQSNANGRTEDEGKDSEDDFRTLLEEFIKEKESAAGFMDSALTTLSFLSKEILGSRSPLIKSVAKETLGSECVATLLTLILRDLEEEKAATEIGAISSTLFPDSLNRIYVDFSREISKFTQNLLTLQIFSDKVQSSFLNHLGIEIQQDSKSRWPFDLHQRSLAILVQVLLLRTSDREAGVMSIWRRVLRTLKEDILSEEPPSTFSEMPVEGAQTLAFLFHTLALMQKKQVLLETAELIVTVGKTLKKTTSSSQVSSLGLLLLFFDYFMRQLYEPALVLLTQIQVNLFNDEGSSSASSGLSYSSCEGPMSTSSLSSLPGKKRRGEREGFLTNETLSEPPNTKPLPPARIFCDCSLWPAACFDKDPTDSQVKPRFYNLIGIEPNPQENPRLDGLAMNFLMNKEKGEKVEYYQVLTAVLRIAEVKCAQGPTADCRGRTAYVQYLLNRLIFSLPPASEFLQNLNDPEIIFNSDFLEVPSRALYLFTWIPRLDSKVFSHWLRDVLTKQGMEVSAAENILKTTTLSSKIVMKVLTKCIDWAEEISSQKVGECPTLYFAFEAVLGHAITNILQISEEEELLYVMIRVLEETQRALKNNALEEVEKRKGNVQSGDWKKSAEHLMTFWSGFYLANPFASVLSNYSDPDLRKVLDEFSTEDFIHFPMWGCGHKESGVLSGEAYLLAVMDGHMSSSQETAIKHIMGTAVGFISSAICPQNTKTPKMVKEQLSALITPLLLDKSAEYIGQVVGSSMDPAWGKTETPMNPRFVEILGTEALKSISSPDLRKALKESSHEDFMVETLEALLNTLKEKQEFETNYIALLTSDAKLLPSLLEILMNTKADKVMSKLCEFLTVILSSSETSEKESKRLVSILTSQLPTIEDSLPARLFSASTGLLKPVAGLFSAVVSHLGQQKEHKRIPSLLEKTIKVMERNIQEKDFSGLEAVLEVLIQMADLCESLEEGHVKLFGQMTQWLQTFTEDLEGHLERALQGRGTYDVNDKDPKSYPALTAGMTIMEYMLEVGRTLQSVASTNPGIVGKAGPFYRLLSASEREGTPGATTPPNEMEDNGFDVAEEEIGAEDGVQGDEDESGGEDSDEEGLNSRLCTYTVTQKEFMSQHWYHCHTCGMVDGVGVCTICARVCHKGHDVTYAKFGSFFCDCGAKSDGSCTAMTRRPPSNPESRTVSGTVLSSYNPFLPQEIPDRPSSPSGAADRRNSSNGAGHMTTTSLSKEKKRGIRIPVDAKWEDLVQVFRKFSEQLPLKTLMKLKVAAQKLAGLKTPIGAFLRVQAALKKFRKGAEGQHEFTCSEEVMALKIPNVGSQENAFENVKLSYNGEQGSLIRQLINAGIIRRTAIACLSSPGSRRQHLAMSGEKGKLSILQLAPLLSASSASEGGKRKTALPRLATITLPFTALTMATNPLRDDVLAVCGLKECHVLVVGTGGSISTHLVMQTQLEGQNHISRPLWLPGSHTQLALVTPDGVKIYDLGKDVISPSFYFLLPSGKVRDATFALQNDVTFIIIIASDGRIYYEKLDELTSAVNGPYYITNDLNYEDTVSFSSCSEGGGGSSSSSSSSTSKEASGVSVHYSHPLKLLFYTYPNGKSYMGFLEDLAGATPLTKAVIINPKGKSPNGAMGLNGWQDVLGHPGLVFASGKDGTPYALLLTEDASQIQEIKCGWKGKPLDMTGIRDLGPSGESSRTSLLILGDDGSMKVFSSTEVADFWLSNKFRPSLGENGGGGAGKNASARKPGIGSRKGSRSQKGPNGQIIFPTDFFEHCQPMNDVEFGGNDLLQIYNTGQLKNRLNTSGMYVVSTKSTGFNLEITNSDPSLVVTGVRVLLGSQDILRVPSHIQIFGRTVNTSLSRARWFDIPLTREESLQADSKLVISFGPSHDAQNITFVDSVKIYGKNKDAFGWPDDPEDVRTPQCPSSAFGPAPQDRHKEETNIERMVVSGLELCELGVSLFPREVGKSVDGILSTATDIYLENYPPFNVPARNLILSVLLTRNAYYEHRDKAVLTQCVHHLLEMSEKGVQDIDPELFHHVVTSVRGIAVGRPAHISQFRSPDLPPDLTPCTIIQNLCTVFEKLVEVNPKNSFLVPVDNPGLQRVEALSSGLAEIIHSVMASDLSLVPSLTPSLLSLLLFRNVEICVPARTVLVKRLRPRNVRKRRVTFPDPSPPHCATPDAPIDSPRESSQAVGNNLPPAGEDGGQEDLPLVEVDEPIVMLDGQDDGLLNPLEAFMGPQGFQLPPGIDLQGDAEDEAMVELAIALSLQEQAGGAALAIQGIQEGLQALEDMHNQHQHHQDNIHPEPNSPPDDPEDDEQDNPEGGIGGGGEGAESDATASQNSDDEGSTVATEGSTMRNSDPASSGSSSNQEGGAPGQQEGHGEQSLRTTESTQERYEFANKNAQGSSTCLPGGKESSSKLSTDPGVSKAFRLAFLRAISTGLGKNCEALSIIPLLQLLLVILAEMDGGTEEEIEVVENLVKKMLDVMNFSNVGGNEEEEGEGWSRNPSSELALVILRMLSILVSRWRGTEQKMENSWIAQATAETIQRLGVVNYCKDLLHLLRPTWKGLPEDVPGGGVLPSSSSSGMVPSLGGPEPLGSTLLKPCPPSSPPDYSPFFLKQYVKTHSNDVLEELALLLSEMALRLPYQIKKVLTDKAIFDKGWEDLLCEMLQHRNAPFVRRQARKLLLNIAGSRDNYHLLRDLHNIRFHLQEFTRLLGVREGQQGFKMEFKYSQLVAMVEHLNTCIDIATQRPLSWQTFCRNEDSLHFLVQVGTTADDSLTTAILTLLKIAVDGVPFDSKGQDNSSLTKLTEEEKALKSLAHQVLDSVDKRTFLEFAKKYLLEHSVLSTRWQGHSLMLAIFQTSDCPHQLKLVQSLWELWPFVPAAGSRAAQFIDILGYATLNNDELKSKDLREQVSFCINSIEAQGEALLGHPNAGIYSSLVPFVSVEGYYLESEPCEICYNIDKPYAVQKLNSIKADAKFTASSQIVKLTSTLSIVRLSIRLTELKKARMIKTMGIYYSPKNIPIVELKNKPALWQMARKVNLSPSQTEIKLDFCVPIVAANVMLEFLEFYENAQASVETLQCPRCSASVPAQPGVCSNCGENVYQCHKCRAINYDERDPFICHQCGHCKYAKMDISVLAKSVVGVDPIENEEDGKKAESAVSSLLEKAHTTYRQQQHMKAGLESMLQSIKEKKSMSGVSLPPFPGGTPSASSSSSSPPSQVPSAVSMPASYAAAAANVLNNNSISIGSLSSVAGGNILTIGSGGQVQLIGPSTGHGLGHGSISAGGPSSASAGSLVLKNVQSLAYCYAIDCKNAYEELNRIMRKVGAYRREMLKIDPLAYVLDSVDRVTYRRCYGCMASSITLSLKLLQALITAGSPRDPFDLSFLSFLLRLSQSAGSTALKEQVKAALCFFVKDDPRATTQLTEMINSRVKSALNRGNWNDLSFETSEEISLLSSLLQMYDSCWEIKLRALMNIFIQAIDKLKRPPSSSTFSQSSSDTGLLSCLKIIQNFIKATQSGEPEKLTISPLEGVHVDLEAWLRGDPTASFESWAKRLPKVKKGLIAPPPTKVGPAPPKKERRKGGEKEKNRSSFLIQKYGRRWVERKLWRIDSSTGIQFDPKELSWLKLLLFNPGSVQTRTFISGLLKDLSQNTQRRLKIMELLTTFMEDLPSYGESCREFMELYRDLAGTPEFAAFLNAKGALSLVCNLLDDQIEKLHQLETLTLHSDLSQGVAVLELSKLLSTLAIPAVRRSKRVSLLSTVLGGYLALKRLRLHRTRPIEEAQEILLGLLEEITSGTEEETKVFMSVCVETLKKTPREDLATPVFVFERVCSLILHEETDIAEFFLTLDKDPQQEDFLQGRMLGNPYSSNEAGIGPLMRDLKNKICTDCELVALLEDDNGMELLVNNKIMSLDLPVKEVYKKCWLPTNGANEPMRIVYRMRGLLGDATEEFIESFASPNEGQEDNEVTYKLAKVFVSSGGLKVVLGALENLSTPGKTKPLIAVCLKLLGYCAKIGAGREALLTPGLNAIPSFLPILRICLEHDLTSIQGSSGIVHLADQVLEILEAMLADSCALDASAYANFAQNRGSIEDVQKLLELSDKLKSRQSTMAKHFKVLAGLTYTDKEKMNLIFDSFKDFFNFIKFDDDPNSEFVNQLEHVCTLVSNVETGPYASTFKDLAIERDLISSCLDYIGIRAPTMKPPLGRPDSEEWKEMVSKPALKYVLRLLAGFATGHAPSQEAVGRDCVYVIHQLEQVSSDEHVGSQAENVLEALRSHDEIWKKVEAARRATREEKKKMAMAMRQRQLNTMGMKTNEKGQVTAATSSILEQMEELAEETGLVCVICREGYKYQPTKVLGIYTFSKRCLMDDLEAKARKTYGYCTVSHFNVVHIDCHMAAIRLARSRDEWESASLQNANTRCNGLIPLWGPQVPESAFAACLARHNAYLQESTGHRDVGFSSGTQDIKLLLLRFADEKTFHEDTGGGGPESNLHLVPYLVHTALYVLNTTRLVGKENNGIEAFLLKGKTGWKDDATSVEGGFYFLTASLMVHSPERWKDNRVPWLKRILVMCGIRAKTSAASTISQYRGGLIFLGLIHGLYTIVFKDVPRTGEWSQMLADYIRKNDEALVKSTSALLAMYQQKLLQAKEIKDFVDILDLKEDIPNIDEWMTELWAGLG